MIDTALSAVAIVSGFLVLRVLGGLVIDEMKGWLPFSGRSLIRGAVRRLPEAERRRWAEEWQAEYEVKRDRPLTALVFAICVWLNAPATARELDAASGISEASEVADSQPAQDAPVRTTFTRKHLEEALENLSYRERRVLELRLGLTGEGRRTHEEIGHIFNVTADRVRYIESFSVKKLESLAEAQKLRDLP